VRTRPVPPLAAIHRSSEGMGVRPETGLDGSELQPELQLGDVVSILANTVVEVDDVAAAPPPAPDSLGHDGSLSLRLPSYGIGHEPHSSDQSGWPDSNRRPLAPKASALAKLRYSPLTSDGIGPHGGGRKLKSAAGYSSSGLRMRLTSERRRLAASLRSRAARLGRVSRRGADGGAVALARMAASLLAAAWRLRNWDRCSEAVTVSTPSTSLPARVRNARSLSSGGSEDVAARSKESSTRLSAVFTDCPPGPGDREKRHDSSAGGITAPRTLTGGTTDQ
jgi:hypothetical protein